jgi:hypothetical protein
MNKIYSLLFIISLLNTSIAKAEKDAAEEYDILPEVRILCNSALDYSREVSFKKIINRYNKQQNCIINGALESMRKGEKTYFSKQFKEFTGDDEILQSSKKIDNKECDNKEIFDYKTVLARQRNSGGKNSQQKYQTYCMVPTKNPQEKKLINKEYSPCRVAEAMLNEWCGYNMAMNIFSNDEKRIKKELAGKAIDEKKLQSKMNFSHIFIKNELDLSVFILEKTINDYEQIYRNLQKSRWWQIYNAQLFEINSIVEKIMKDYFINLIAKFKNVQSQ